MTSFIEFKLDRVINRALTEMKFHRPTEIQQQAIPAVLGGHDVCATAITGSGKSAAFLVPIVQKLIKIRNHPGPKALIMSPTRELAQQLHSVYEQISKYSLLTSALVIGGISAEEQAEKLNPPPDILFATPGRIVDQLFNSKTITGDHILYYVLDEADRLLGRGFEAELTAINSKLTNDHQTLLFSATMNDQVQKLVKKVLKNDTIMIRIDMFGELSPNLKQVFIKTKTDEKRLPYLVALVKNKCNRKTIVFFPTKELAHRASLLFNYANIPAAELHANLPQPDREKSVELFTTGEVKILLASDLAARGLDIKDIENVINFTIPNEIERYIHRVGRTARNGKEGTAYSFIHTPNEKKIEKKMEKKSDPEKVEKMTIPDELFQEALSIVKKFEAKIEADLQKEEEERIRRAEANEKRRMNQLLDIEEEIPTKDVNLEKKKKKR